MVNDYNCPIKEKSIRWQRKYSIQFVEMERMSFKEWSIKMASIGYFSELFRSMEDYRLDIGNAS